MARTRKGPAKNNVKNASGPASSRAAVTGDILMAGSRPAWGRLCSPGEDPGGFGRPPDRRLLTWGELLDLRSVAWLGSELLAVWEHQEYTPARAREDLVDDGGPKLDRIRAGGLFADR